MAIYEPHPVFELPDSAAAIWRYMSFSKFVAMLNTSALYFTVASKFEDKWEGTLPLKNKEKIDPRIISFFEQYRSTNAVNCWHQRDNESATMWKNYTQGNEGIAIKSTVGHLTQSFRNVEGTITFNSRVHVGKVKYIDYAQEVLNTTNGYIPLLCKRNFFVDEQEIRAVIGDGLLSGFFVQGLPGINVPVDLNMLIDAIYVDPVAADGFFDLVKSIVNEQYAVSRSSIGEKPPLTTDGPPVRAYVAVKKAGKDWEIQ